MSESCPITVFTKWLDQYLNFERTPKKNIFWLDTMQYLAKRFNNPQECCRSFHVAGSKGKGSVSKMIASILDEAGYSTGLYSSPHILRFEERVGSAKGPFDSSVYEKSVSEVMNYMQSVIPENLPGERPVTWFELVTLFAMICFRNAKVDWAVYEVGIGGRLDATNIITPDCCCIGPIELEHTEYLGDTIEKIAAEKGGIIKEGVSVIIAPQKPEARKVFERIAAEKNAPVIFIEDVLKKSEYVYKKEQYSNTIGMEITIDSSIFKRPLKTLLQMPGGFQVTNAAVAAIAVKTMFPDLDESIIEKGLAKAKLPGRFEIITDVCGYPDIPELILDGAHTVNSINFTMQTFNILYGNISENEKHMAHLLFACAADKDIEDISKMFKNRFERIMLTKPGEVKASDTERMEKAFEKAGIAHESCSDYLRAIENSLTEANNAKMPLLVTGSFYLVAEVKKFLLGKKCICGQ